MARRGEGLILFVCLFFGKETSTFHIKTNKRFLNVATTLFHTYSPVRSSILQSLYNLGAIQSLQIKGEQKKRGICVRRIALMGFCEGAGKETTLSLT